MGSHVAHPVSQRAKHAIWDGPSHAHILITQPTLLTLLALLTLLDLLTGINLLVLPGRVG